MPFLTDDDFRGEVNSVKMFFEEINNRKWIMAPMAIFIKDGTRVAIGMCRDFRWLNDAEEAFRELFSFAVFAEADEVLFCADSWIKIGADDKKVPSVYVADVKRGDEPRLKDLPYFADNEGHYFWLRIAEHNVFNMKERTSVIDMINGIFEIPRPDNLDMYDVKNMLATKGHNIYILADHRINVEYH